MGIVADIKYLMLHLVIILDSEEDGAADIMDMDKSPFVGFFEKDEKPVHISLIHKIIDEKVQAHPGGYAECCGKAKAYGIMRVVKDKFFGLCFGAGIMGKGIKRRFFRADITCRGSVVADGRGIDKALGGRDVFDHILCAFHVDGISKVGIFITRGEADDGGKMDDEVLGFDGEVKS